jgi:hypothetical protein
LADPDVAKPSRKGGLGGSGRVSMVDASPHAGNVAALAPIDDAPIKAANPNTSRRLCIPTFPSSSQRRRRLRYASHKAVKSKR